MNVMNAMNALSAGQADALTRAAQALQPKEGSIPSAVSQEENEAVQRVIDDTVRLTEEVLRQIALAWKLLPAGQIDNPQQEGENTLAVAESTRGLLRSLEENGGAWVAQGILRVELAAVGPAKARLEREVAHLKENWPMIAPEKVEEARLAYDNIGHPTFEEFARQAGLDPAAAPLELPVPGWQHLVIRKHSWRRHLFLVGRNMTVRQLVGTVKVNGWSEDEAAKNLDLPVEAVREAFRYANENAKLFAAEAEYEGLFLAQRGLGHGTRAGPR